MKVSPELKIQLAEKVRESMGKVGGAQDGLNFPQFVRMLHFALPRALSPADRPSRAQAPRLVPDLSEVTSIACGAYHLVLHQRALVEGVDLQIETYLFGLCG